MFFHFKFNLTCSFKIVIKYAFIVLSYRHTLVSFLSFNDCFYGHRCLQPAAYCGGVGNAIEDFLIIEM